MNYWSNEVKSLTACKNILYLGNKLKIIEQTIELY